MAKKSLEPLIVPDTPFRLETPEPGALDMLRLTPVNRRPPAAGEVELHAQTAALNFRDVLIALGMYPDMPAGPVTFAGDCAGTVVAVGPGVERFRVGDAVFGPVAITYSSYITTPANILAHKPANLTFAEAVTIPGVFLTAAYALEHLARLAAGERVLIHAATGGVGLAAVQLSQQIGAEIFATAGSPEKRDYLRTLGIEHVMDSRSLDFADEVMDITHGKGVDVVLNSLAGDFLTKSLAVLGSGGRFLEIGKRDIYDNRALELYPFRNNLAFFGIDLELVWQQRPAFVLALFDELLQRFTNGTLHPLPHRIFPIAEVVDAFRFMRRAKHMGKIVIAMPA